MTNESFAFLKSIEETPSVSGFEQPVARLVRKRMKPLADQISTDVHGNVLVALNPKGAVRVMLAGHIDQIGLMVRHVTDDGYLYFDAVGGIDKTVLPGLRVTVQNERGSVEGVIGRKPIHLMKPEDRDKGKVEMTDLWIDIGVKNKAEALERVAIADSVTFALGVTRLGEDLITGPGLDDKVGAFVVMEALRLVHERTRGKAARKLGCAVYAVATVQEEIGLRGAQTATFGIDPHVGIAVDVTHATDNPGAEKKLAGDVALGKGPVIRLGANINPVLGKLLLETARRRKIPHQIGDAPRGTGTDANIMQVTRAGVATAVLGLPNRYMHTPVEVCSLSDLESSAELLAETILRIDARTSFVPE